MHSGSELNMQSTSQRCLCRLQVKMKSREKCHAFTRNMLLRQHACLSAMPCTKICDSWVIALKKKKKNAWRDTYLCEVETATAAHAKTNTKSFILTHILLNCQVHFIWNHKNRYESLFYMQNCSCFFYWISHYKHISHRAACRWWRLSEATKGLTQRYTFQRQPCFRWAVLLLLWR